MLQSSKEQRATSAQKTADASRPPRRTRVKSTWNDSRFLVSDQKDTPILKPGDLTAAQLEKRGFIPSSFFSFDHPTRDDSTQTFADTTAAQVDIESDTVREDLIKKFRELVDFLELRHPPCGRVLLWRMEGVKLEVIGRRLCNKSHRRSRKSEAEGVSRERVRQLEAKAKRLMREDSEVRAFAQAAGIDVEAYSRHVAFLNELGFSPAFISRWEKYGFPFSDHLTIAAVLITEAAYPHCVVMENASVVPEPGKDRLDKVRFGRILAKISPNQIDNICDDFGSEMDGDALGRLIGNLKKYLGKCVERAVKLLNRPKPEPKSAEPEPKPVTQPGIQSETQPTETPQPNSPQSA